MRTKNIFMYATVVLSVFTINSNLNFSYAQETTPVFSYEESYNSPHIDTKETVTVTVTEISESCHEHNHQHKPEKEKENNHNHLLHSHNNDLSDTAKEGAIWFTIFTLFHILMHLILGFLGAYVFVGTRDKIRKKKHTHIRPYIHTCNDKEKKHNKNKRH